MLDKALVEKFYYAVRAQGFNEVDIAWMLKQHGEKEFAKKKSLLKHTTSCKRQWAT
jgi:hypothetical protein